jgi:hypothetical protein
MNAITHRPHDYIMVDQPGCPGVDNLSIFAIQLLYLDAALGIVRAALRRHNCQQGQQIDYVRTVGAAEPTSYKMMWPVFNSALNCALDAMNSTPHKAPSVV